MTHLAVSVAGDSIERVRADIAAAADRGCDLAELRLDMMEEIGDEDVRALGELNRPPTPLILTIRSAAEGGHWDGNDNERISRLIDLGPTGEFIDVEWAVWTRSANIRQKVKLALGRAGESTPPAPVTANADRRRLILSRHHTRGRPATLQAEFLAMIAEDACDVPKLAWRARSVRDNFEAFELMRSSPRPAIVICMGEDGLPSRVLAPKFGAFATFASPESGRETAPGQETVERMKALYRWDAIDPRTEVYGVIGDPVAHSLSPRVHNAALTVAGVNAVYLPWRVNPGYESFKAFMAEILDRPWLDARGFSVTAPHKESALRFVRERGGRVDAKADRVGAVNTIRIDPDGRLRATNTDYDGVLSAVAGVMGRPPAGLRALILGAGGMARAAAAALLDAGADVTVCARTRGRAEALAAQLGCRCAEWDSRATSSCDLLVNCTPVGQTPHTDESPMPADRLTMRPDPPVAPVSNRCQPEARGRTPSPHLTVFDTVYHPRRTRLLTDAQNAGCRTIDGLSLFIAQAAAQFKYWTARPADPAALRAAAEAGSPPPPTSGPRTT